MLTVPTTPASEILKSRLVVADLSVVSSHNSSCAGADKASAGRCRCDYCKGSRHGVRTGSFSAAAKKQLRNLIDAHVIQSNAKEKLEIRAELFNGARKWLTTDSAGCVMDELAEAATEALEATVGLTATSRKTSSPLDKRHILCGFFTSVYNFRKEIETAASAGVSTLVEVVANRLSDELGLEVPAREIFAKTLEAAAATSLEKKLGDLILIHAGLPTTGQLVVLIAAFCPDLNAHPEASQIVDHEVGQVIVKAATNIGLQCTLGPKPSPAPIASHNAGVASPARGITAARS
jgi:hypothetical protein